MLRILAPFFFLNIEIFKFPFPAIHYPSISQELWEESYCWLLGPWVSCLFEGWGKEIVRFVLVFVFFFHDWCLSPPNIIEVWEDLYLWIKDLSKLRAEVLVLHIAFFWVCGATNILILLCQYKAFLGGLLCFELHTNFGVSILTSLWHGEVPMSFFHVTLLVPRIAAVLNSCSRAGKVTWTIWGFGCFVSWPPFLIFQVPNFW